jgi:hypothetical protein
MKRLRVAAILTILVLMVSAAPVSAGFGWCRSDPVVLIDGHIVDIWVTAPLLAPLMVTGPNTIVITTPPEVDSQLVLKTLGFGKGEVVRFETSPRLKVSEQGMEVEVAVYVPATDSSMPVGVEFAPDLVGILMPARAEGTANSWVVLDTVLR